MEEPTQKKVEKKDTRAVLVKSLVYGAAILFLLGAILFGAYRLSTVFSSGLSADVFIYPLMMIKKLIFGTLIITLIIIVLIVYGVKHPKLWFLIPVGILLVSFYWLSINNSVYKAYVKKFIAGQEK